MRTYELMTITKASLGDEKAKAVSKEIVEVITSNKGSVKKADAWGKRKFAYEIKGAKEGYYDLFQVELEPENVDKVKNKLKLMDSIVRYLFTSASEKSAAPKTKAPVVSESKEN